MSRFAYFGMAWIMMWLGLGFGFGLDEFGDVTRLILCMIYFAGCLWSLLRVLKDDCYTDKVLAAPGDEEGQNE